MQKYIKWFSFKRPPIKQKCLALQEHWEENIPSYLKVEEDMFFSVQSTKKHCQISISHQSAQLTSPVGGRVSCGSWPNSHRTQWPARPALLRPAYLVWMAPRPRQATAVCTERWGKRARVLSLSFRLFRAVGSSFGPVWFSPPSQERRFVLIW